ncbi:type II toxin-antitoxin system RelE/ParE family toxin [Acetobacter fabarum]|uniref:Addiction module toxin RelE n=2 Tax=Acetobacter fabarum TaxID=483199 RepID=A0A269XPG3_9PROT|nr:addiction module toxin RelE [Acetobacter fabarum]PEN21726.1 type II toxin-antitoxin system RelE/ParE family toxin [Acetobacter fabarum]
MTEGVTDKEGQQKVYKVEFDDEALDEWDALDGSIRKQFLKKLQKLKHIPYSPGNALTGGLAGYYKIKLRDVGYRLVYSIEEDRIVIFVLAVGRREDSEVYADALSRQK